MLQRDAFIEEIIRSLDKDKNIFFLSADFGAQALDELRKRFPNNFLHCGISEQAMLDVAAGLALVEGAGGKTEINHGSTEHAKNVTATNGCIKL